MSISDDEQLFDLTVTPDATASRCLATDNLCTLALLRDNMCNPSKPLDANDAEVELIFQRGCDQLLMEPSKSSRQPTNFTSERFGTSAFNDAKIEAEFQQESGQRSLEFSEGSPQLASFTAELLEKSAALKKPQAVKPVNRHCH